jgi:hypothetical protein
MQIAVDSKYSVSKGNEYWVKEKALAVSKNLTKTWRQAAQVMGDNASAGVG